jgi:hypothetical protein
MPYKDHAAVSIMYAGSCHAPIVWQRSCWRAKALRWPVHVYFCLTAWATRAHVASTWIDDSARDHMKFLVRSVQPICAYPRDYAWQVLRRARQFFDNRSFLSSGHHRHSQLPNSITKSNKTKFKQKKTLSPWQGETTIYVC